MWPHQTKTSVLFDDVFGQAVLRVVQRGGADFQAGAFAQVRAIASCMPLG